MRLADRIAEQAKARPCITVELTSFLSSPIDGAIKMRPLFVAELNASVESALKVRKSLLAALPEQHARQFLDDPSFIEDVKVCEMLWHACRDCDDVSQHAFPSAQWMRENLTNDELAALDFHYQRACANDSPVKEPLDLDHRNAIVRACAETADTNLPDAMLGRLPRVVLCDLFVWLAREHVRGSAMSALTE